MDLDINSVASRVEFNEFVNITLVVAAGSKIVLSKETIPYVARIAPMTNDCRKQLVGSYDSELRRVNKSHSTTFLNKVLSRNHALANVSNDVSPRYALMIIIPSRIKICTSVDTMDDIGISLSVVAHLCDLHRTSIG